MLTFFGLNNEYRMGLFNQIHEIVFHSKGAYSWDIIYNMPIWLRNFTFNKIRKYYEDEAKINEPKSLESLMKDKIKIHKPDIFEKNPTYSTKIKGS